MAKLGMHLNQLISDKLIEKVEENEAVTRYNITFGTGLNWLYLVRDNLTELWFLERKGNKGKVIQSKPNDLYMLNF